MPTLRAAGAACLLFLPAIAALPTAPLGASEADQPIPTVSLKTSAGTIVLELDSASAPATVENFLRYVDDDFYDGTIFHRVIEGFMIQGGGFTPALARKSTRDPIVNEASNGLANTRYTIAMARTNAPHSATAQFFINTVDNGNLDHTAATPRGWGYAVFGRVVGGHDVIDRISSTPTGASGPFSRDVPLEPIIIESAEQIERHVEAGEEADASDASGDDDARTSPAPASGNDNNTGSGDASDGTGDEPRDGTGDGTDTSKAGKLVSRVG